MAILDEVSDDLVTFCGQNRIGIKALLIFGDLVQKAKVGSNITNKEMDYRTFPNPYLAKYGDKWLDEIEDALFKKVPRLFLGFFSPHPNTCIIEICRDMHCSRFS